jgi:hypothetical protein
MSGRRPVECKNSATPAVRPSAFGAPTRALTPLAAATPQTLPVVPSRVQKATAPEPLAEEIRSEAASRAGHDFGQIAVLQPRAKLASAPPDDSAGQGAEPVARLAAHAPAGNQGASPFARPSSRGHTFGRISVLPLQAQLTVSQPGDPAEQEAERVADEVMRMEAPGPARAPVAGTERDHALRRQENGEESPIAGATPLVNQALGSSGEPLDTDARAFLEPRFGHDFSQVRVHTDARAAELARAVNARAYTVGREIVFGAAEYAPNTSQGRRLLAHELTHVVQQQSASTVSPAAKRTTDETRDSVAKETPSAQRQNAGAEPERPLGAPSGFVARQAGPPPAAPPTSGSPGASSPPAGPPSVLMSMTPAYAQSLSDPALEAQVNAVRAQLLDPNVDESIHSAAQENLVVLETEASRRSLAQLQEQGADFDPLSRPFVNYCRASEELRSLGGSPPEDPEGILIPGDQLLVVDEAGQVQLLSGGDFVGVEDDLFPMMDGLATASQTGSAPDLGIGSFEQVLLWEDGRAALTPPVAADLATLLVQGQPIEFEMAAGVGALDRPWDLVRRPEVQTILTSGVYQLGSYPISRFNGVSLPPGSRVRFADVGRAMKGQMDSRLVTIFERGTKRYYAWDAHLPVPGAKVSHPFYHVNQKGMHGLFGHSDHAPIPPSMLRQARGLRYIKMGGRVLLVAGILVDGALLIDSAAQSIEQGTPRPVIAQAVRTIGSWGGAWAGAKLGCAAGGLAGVETGPGAVLTCIAGGIIGGFGGYLGADWIADMISED